MRVASKNRKLLFWGSFAVFIGVGLYNGLTVNHLTIKSGKIHTPVRLLLLTDLHSCKYGENQSELLKAIDRQKPDVVLMAGDMVDDVLPQKPAFEFFRGVSKYPCYYVTGNHEFWSGRFDKIKDDIRACGITVLEGGAQTLDIGGQPLQIAGVDDPDAGVYKAQIDALLTGLNPELYTILLAHRPERFAEYASFGAFGLVLSGHAHGGQWRLPVPIFSPDQGFFPKYAAGLYETGGTKMIVSRGLARETTIVPRIFNTPEIVVIDLVPLES